MRGNAERQAEMLLGITADQLVPSDHPIRRIKSIVEPVLSRMSPLFDQMYAECGRPSIPPEHLLKASLLIALFSVRSERQFCERLHYDLLFKWFMDLNVGDGSFDPTTFTKNRRRLLEHQVADAFFAEVVAEARRRRLLSSDHFTVDGTLIEAWGSVKSYRPRDSDDDSGTPSSGGRNTEVDFRGQRRKRDTHVSRTDPEAQLYTKGSGQAAKLSYMGHVLTENRNGLIVGVELTEATGFAERDAALRLLDHCVSGRATLAADRGYDTASFVASCRKRGITPHVAQHTTGRRSAIDGRTTRHSGYAVSQRVRKRVEEVFGWEKTVGGLRKLRYIGRARSELCFKFVAAAYNLLRIARLEARAA